MTVHHHDRMPQPALAVAGRGAGRGWPRSPRTGGTIAVTPLVTLTVLVAWAGIARPAAAETYLYADPTGFSALNTGTSASFTLANLTIQATRLTSFSGSNGLTLGQESLVFPATNPSNPDWIAGTRDMFRLRFDDGTTLAPTPDGTVGIQYVFSSPLPTGSFLVFADFDVKEEMRIRAFDATDSLIGFATWSFARENGGEIGGAALTLPTWSGSAGYSGVLAYGNNPFISANNPVVTLQSSVPIARLVYESDNDPYDTVTHNDLYFNFTMPASAVPEIDPAGLGSVVALLGGSLGILERRRRHVRQRCMR